VHVTCWQQRRIACPAGCMYSSPSGMHAPRPPYTTRRGKSQPAASAETGMNASAHRCGCGYDCSAALDILGQPSQQHMPSNYIQPGSQPPVNRLETLYAHALFAHALPPAAACWVPRQATAACPAPFAHAFSGTAARAAGQSPRAARPARPPAARRRGPGSPRTRGSRMRARRQGGTLPARRPARRRPRPPR